MIKVTALSRSAQALLPRMNAGASTTDRPVWVLTQPLKPVPFIHRVLGQLHERIVTSVVRIETNPFAASLLRE